MTLKELERLAHLNARYAEMAYDLGQETGRKNPALQAVTHCISDIADYIAEYVTDCGEGEEISVEVKMCFASCLEKQINLFEELYSK